MKMNKKDITVAACGAFAAVILSINWLVPVNAQTPGQQSPVDVLSSVQMHKQAFVTLAQDFIATIDQMSQELVALRKENAQLKSDLAKATLPKPVVAPNSSDATPKTPQ